MRAWGLMCFQMKRQRVKMILYVSCVLAISLVSIFMLLPYARTLSLEGGVGDMAVRESNAGLTLYDNPASMTNASLFSAFVWISALWLVRRERKFEVSLSVARFEMLAGSFLYIVAAAAAMTLSYLLVSVVGRGVMWLGGFRLRNGWNLKVLLTGGDDRLCQTLLVAFTGMISTACAYTFIGYLMARWWKQILILFAVGVALLILFLTQMNTVRLFMLARDWLAQNVAWLVDELLAAYVRAVLESNPYQVALYDLLIALGAMALSYPVMRGMPVVARE